MNRSSTLATLLLAAATCVSACQQQAATATESAAAASPAPEPVAVDGVGCVIFDAPITRSSSVLLERDIDKLHQTGAREIRLAINSPGGEIEAAQGIVGFMHHLHDDDGVTFKVYDIGVVASAASYVFLNGQVRYTDPRGTFLFHAARSYAPGGFTTESIHDAEGKLDAYERLMRATLASRSHLTDAETLTYVRRTVVLNADDARRDGIVDAIQPFAAPKGVRVWVIRAKPTTPTPTPARPPAS